MQTSASGRALARSQAFLGRLKWLRYILVGLLLGVVLRLAVVQVYTVSGESMEPTLGSHERVLVWKPSAWSDPVRGAVVVFDGRDSIVDGAAEPNVLRSLLLAEPLDQGLLVKRVIGLGGDEVRCCDSQGRLLVNGEPLDEPYVIGLASEIIFDVVVPADHMFVLGDNRGRSFDSLDRLGSPGGGMVPVNRIIGEVVAVAWPTARMRTVD